MNKKVPEENDNELAEIIRQYENSKKENKGIYLDADQYADIAYYYIQQDRMDEALEVVESGLSMHPENTALLIAKTIIRLDTDELAEARNLLDSITEKTLEVQMLEIEVLAKEERVSEAENLISQLAPDEKDYWMMMQIAEACLEAGFPEKAEEWIMKAFEIAPENEEIILVLTECQFALGKFNQAVTSCNLLLDMQPYSSLYWTNLAKAYLNLSMYSKAIEAADFAIVAEEENGEAHAIKGNSLFGLDNYTSAIEEYRKARELKGLPDGVADLFIGFCYTNMEEWSMAYESYRTAIGAWDAKSPVISTLWVNLARSSYEMGRMDEAIQCCETLHLKFPESEEAYLLHGKICMETGDPDEAMRLWDEAIKISPDEDAWNYIGVACLDNDQFDYAEKAFMEVKRINPDYPELRENLALVYLGKQDSEKFDEYKEDFKKYLDNRGNTNL